MGVNKGSISLSAAAQSMPLILLLNITLINVEVCVILENGCEKNVSIYSHKLSLSHCKSSGNGLNTRLSSKSSFEIWMNLTRQNKTVSSIKTTNSPKQTKSLHPPHSPETGGQGCMPNPSFLPALPLIAMLHCLYWSSKAGLATA